jgi:hypothetical protein
MRSGEGGGGGKALAQAWGGRLNVGVSNTRRNKGGIVWLTKRRSVLADKGLVSGMTISIISPDTPYLSCRKCNIAQQSIVTCVGDEFAIH